MKSKKSLIINITILIVISIIVLFKMINNNDFNIIILEIKDFEIKFIFLSIISLLIFMLVDVLIVKRITQKFTNKKRGLLEVVLSAFFYNGITPFSSGGQPVQVYYMDKLGIEPSKSTVILLMRFVIFQITLVLMSLIALVLFFDEVMAINGINALIFTGFSVTAIVLFILLGITFSNKFEKVLKGMFKLIGKIKFLNSLMNKLIVKTSDFVEEFQSASKEFFRDWKLVLEIFIYTFIRLLAYYSITYYILVGLGEPRSNELYLMSVAYASFAFALTAFIPTPGASGGAEYAFKILFLGIIANETAIVGILLWRLFTYYIPVIIGLVAAIRLGTLNTVVKEPKEVQL